MRLQQQFPNTFGEHSDVKKDLANSLIKYKQYQRLSEEADVGHTGNYTTRWWINKTMAHVQGEDGKVQNYRIKLFE